MRCLGLAAAQPPWSQHPCSHRHGRYGHSQARHRPQSVVKLSLFAAPSSPAHRTPITCPSRHWWPALDRDYRLFAAVQCVCIRCRLFRVHGSSNQVLGKKALTPLSAPPPVFVHRPVACTSTCIALLHTAPVLHRCPDPVPGSHSLCPAQPPLVAARSRGNTLANCKRLAHPLYREHKAPVPPNRSRRIANL
jgi:hypothetical protein